jgi:serine phosphatase RsbU (regulator of sigma subunit)
MTTLILDRDQLRSHDVLRYGIAGLATAIGLGLAILLRPYVGAGSLSPLYASVAIAVWAGGLGPGIAALVLCTWLSPLVLLHPLYDLNATGRHDLARWLLFVAVGGLIVAVGHALDRRREQLLTASRDLEALQVITAVLARAEDPDEVADAVLSHGLAAVNAVGGAVLVYDDERKELRIQRSVGYPPRLLDHLQRIPVEADVPIAVATRTGSPIFFRSLAEVGRRFPNMIHVFGATGKAGAVLPLVRGGQPVGGLVLVFPVEREFSDESVSQIVTLARLCQEALARSRQQQAERQIAKTFRRSLLPIRFPNVPGLEIAGLVLPGAVDAEVGGDWYDGVELDDGNVVLTVGDVAGHGIQAAARMSRVRIALKAYAVEGCSPAEALRRLDHFLGHLPEDYFATAVVVRVDPGSGSIEYACAGHPPPVLIPRTSFAPRFLGDGRSGPIDAGIEPHERGNATDRLAPGDTLLLYTDGLIEEPGLPLDDGLARLADLLDELRVESLAELVEQTAEVILQERRSFDDVTLLAARIGPNAAPPPS